MSDGFWAFVGVVFSFAFMLACAAWVTVLPTIGLLWIFGGL